MGEYTLRRLKKKRGELYGWSERDTEQDVTLARYPFFLETSSGVLSLGVTVREHRNALWVPHAEAGDGIFIHSTNG